MLVSEQAATTELTKALSRLAGNRHSDGVSSIVSADDRSVIINGCHNMMVAMRAQQAALPFLQGVKVKKLEWSDHQHGSRCVTDRVYDISIWIEGGKPLYVDSYTTMRRFRIMNEAKAAAQADYEARILSAIEVSPSPRAQALEEVTEPPVRGEPWMELWYGSEPDKGVSIWSQTEYGTHKNMLFHVGPDTAHLELARTIVAAHNASLRALSSQPVSDGWLPIEKEPDSKQGPFLVTNNPSALNAFGRPSHVWCVSGIYKDNDGSFCAFEGNQKIHGLVMFMPVSTPLPASPGASATRPTGDSNHEK